MIKPVSKPVPGAARLEKLRMHYEDMQRYEQAARLEGNLMIAGIDEAGRGPLAGPVVTCACILDPERPVYGVDDSKKLSPARRVQLYDEILEKCIGFSVGMTDSGTIDRINILNATKEAMRIAAAGLSLRPDLLLIDAVDLKGTGIAVLPIIRGDSLSVSIAAASIIAKVTRDRIMEAYDQEYPGYGFSRHKGYGTAEHYDALRKMGPCPIHRMTFLRGVVFDA